MARAMKIILVPLCVLSGLWMPVASGHATPVPTFAPRQSHCALRSVTDYFYGLPRSFFNGYSQRGFLKPSNSTIVDKRYRFLSVAIEGGFYEVSVFRYGGVDTVAAVYNEDGGATELRFYQLRKSRMVDVTACVLPIRLTSNTFRADLPRQGSSITLHSGDAASPSLLYLDWKEGRFVTLRSR